MNYFLPPHNSLSVHPFLIRSSTEYKNVDIYSVKLLLGKWKDFEKPKGSQSRNMSCTVARASLESGEGLGVGLGTISTGMTCKDHTASEAPKGKDEKRTWDQGPGSIRA